MLSRKCKSVIDVTYISLIYVNDLFQGVPIPGMAIKVDKEFLKPFDEGTFIN